MGYNLNTEIRSRDANVDNTTWQGNLEDGPTLPEQPEPPPEATLKKTPERKAPKGKKG